MKIEEVKKLPPLERMIYWIREREAIRLRKEAGEHRPWTDDLILDTYRFCNVRRMDDRVSRWLLDNWYTPNRDHPNIVIAAALARHFNLPNTLQAIGFPYTWEPEKIRRVLRDLKGTGRNLFNGAYIIRASGDYPDKAEMVIDETVQSLVDTPLTVDTASMRNSTEALMGYRNFGSFMAGQVIADLRWAMTGIWRDRKTWAPVGPGSIRGMNILQGRDHKYSLNQTQFLEELLDFVRKCRSKLPEQIIGRLEAHDYQNLCCEYWKYSKCLLGLGRPKQGYHGV
jgi:hypothetical protein